MKKFKYEKVMEYIRREFVDKGRKGVIPSEPVLAKMLNISRFPVNRAVNQLVDEGVLFRIDGVGTFVKGGVLEDESMRGPGNRNLIGVVSNVGAVPPELLTALSRELSHDGYFLAHVFQETEENEPDNVIRQAGSIGLEGVFLNPGVHFGQGKSLSLVAAERYVAAGLKPVVIVRPLPGYNGPRVLVDNAGGTAAAVQWMFENGYSKVAYLGKDDYIVGRERAMGYQLGLGYAGAEYDESLVALDRNGANFVSTVEGFVEESIRRILSVNPDCKAFVVFNMNMAYCLYRKLNDLDMFTDDMVIAGFEPAQQYDPEFNRHYLAIETPYEEIGRMAVELMIRQLQQDELMKEVKRIQPELRLPGCEDIVSVEQFRLLA